MENLTEDMRCPKERVFFYNSVYMLVASLMISAWGHFLVQDISDWICIRHRFTDVCILIFWLILSHPEYKNKIKLSQCVAEPTCFSRIVFEQSFIIFLVSVGPTFCQAGPSRASLTVRCKWESGMGVVYPEPRNSNKSKTTIQIQMVQKYFCYYFFLLCDFYAPIHQWLLSGFKRLFKSCPKQVSKCYKLFPRFVCLQSFHFGF